MPHPRPAVQERSRETLDRILDAAASAISERGFEAVTLREICDRSGVSTGAFYARFRRKEDLALPLFDSLSNEFLEVVDDYLARRQAVGLSASMPLLLGAVIGLYRRRGGLLRALTAQAWTSKELADAMRALNDELFSRLLAPPYDETIRHPRPEVATRLGLLCVMNALKEIVLDQQLFQQPQPFDDQLLVEELSILFRSYLDYEPD